MGIALGTNFTLNAALPLDDRYIVADITARDAIPALRRYKGLVTYVESEDMKYELIGGIDNANWVEAGSGAGGVGGSRLNLMEDGSFEDGVSGCYINGTGTVVQASAQVLATPSNEFYLVASVDSGSELFLPDFTLPASYDDVSMTLSFWAKCDAGEAVLYHTTPDGDTALAMFNNSISKWQKYSFRLKGVTGLNNIWLQTTSVGACEILLDEVFFGAGDDPSHEGVSTLGNARRMTILSDYNMLDNVEDFVMADTTITNITITLPTPIGFRKPLTIFKTSDVNTLIIQSILGEYINGLPYIEIYDNNQSVTLVSDDSQWWII